MPDIKEKTREMRCDGRAGRVLRDERECGGDGDEGGAEDGGETREEEVVLYCLRRKKKERSNTGMRHLTKYRRREKNYSV